MTHQPGQERFRVIRPEEMRWRAFPPFPSEARLAVLTGDPTKPGPYVIRVRLPHNVRMMPHRHPEDRIYTVISGVFYIGLGDLFDANGLTAHGPGSVVVLPGGQPHFHWARSGEYVTQVTAIGPLGLEYVDPAHDPGSAGHTALGETAVSNDCRGQARPSPSRMGKPVSVDSPVQMGITRNLRCVGLRPSGPATASYTLFT